MNINDLINDFVAKKAEKEALNEKIKDLNGQLATIESDIMMQMTDVGVNQVASDKASCTMKLHKRPAIADWQLFYEYVAKTNQFELLHKRLSSAAFVERWEAGEEIPGTTASSVWELSVRRK